MKIHFQTLGCRLNQAESERMARGFKLAGHKITQKPEDADLRIINSCTVTKNAGDDSRRAARAYHGGQKIVVTGCHSEMHPEDFVDADLLIPNAEKEELAALVMEKFGMEGLALGMDRDPSPIYPLSVKNTRAFVKIQDGCDMRCTFCLTTLARGVSRSRVAGEILDEIQALAEAGCQEAVLTGVHAGSYGLDIHQDLGWLIDRILSRTAIPRLRLSSLEPWNFRHHWVELWERFGDRLCRHLHMSLQSGSASVLKRMARCYDPATYAEKLDAARVIPGMAITTDIIVGFPGETPEEHTESLAFAKAMHFSGAHLFSYSLRPGTSAATLPDQGPAEVKKHRFHEMKAVIAQSERAFVESQLGEALPVLWQQAEHEGSLRGLSDNYLHVHTDPALAKPNTLTHTRLLHFQGRRIMAEPIPSLLQR
ncbi:MAG: MiaB/RimO family radical SAM methylthiotransferase [Verrucomicrobiota bacterium]